MLSQLILSLVPAGARVRIRRSPFIRGMMKRLWGGIRTRPYPDSPFTFHYDGYRNISFEAHGLADLERDERNVVARILARRPPTTVWDIGANIGFWSLFLTTAAPPGTEIRCFEPDPDNLTILRLNCDRNALHWIIRPFGLSDHAGSAAFYGDPVTGATGTVEKGHDFIGNYYAANRPVVTIELTTMDDELAAGATPPGFIKMDVEGHELSVFNGGRKMLRDHRPMLIFESTREQEAIGKMLKELDYRLFDPHGCPLQAVSFNTLALPSEIADDVLRH